MKSNPTKRRSKKRTMAQNALVEMEEGSVLRTNSKCRACESKQLHQVLDLGKMPLANSFLSTWDLEKPEPSFPLDVYSCEDCGLLQLVHVVSPEVLFRDYIYVSTTSETLQKHFANLAREIKERYRLGPSSLVVEVASNDGLLLKKFRDIGVHGIGVEPAVNIAAMARRDGLEVVNEFFNQETAKKVLKEFGPADVLLGNNVLAHVNDLADFLGGVELILRPSGGVSFEVPYVRDLIEHKEYDTIYHEHLSYFSVKVLEKLFQRFGLSVYDVERVPIHGGSLRVHARKGGDGQRTLRLDQILKEEEALGLNTLSFQKSFAEEVSRTRKAILSLLKKLKQEGKRVVGYGAPAKGNTQLNYCGIGTNLLEYTVDKSSLKQGKFTPGMRLPVFPVEKLLEDQPDYVFIIAWNFADEIMRQQALYRERGGKFIVPIPEPIIV